MAGLNDFETGQLVADVKQLTKDVETMTLAMQDLTKELREQQLALAKGKGMVAGIVFLSTTIGATGSLIASKFFGE